MDKSDSSKFKNPTQKEIHAYISAWDGDITEQQARYLIEINFLRGEINRLNNEIERLKGGDAQMPIDDKLRKVHMIVGG